MTLKFGSLFAGIGGFDLGLEWAGMECAWQVEVNEYARQVLRAHWPNVQQYGDIKAVNPEDLEPVDVICGGFPCQPVSIAGKGKAQDDERWLWPEFLRVVRGVRPRYVLVENVSGLLARGLGIVLGDLASIGYDAEWEGIPASALGAPHRRWRVWIVAYPNSSASSERGQRQAPEGQGAGRGDDRAGSNGDSERQVAVRGAGEDPGVATGISDVADAESEPVGTGPGACEPSGDARFGGRRSCDGSGSRRTGNASRLDVNAGDVPDAGSNRLEGVFASRVAARATLGEDRDFWRAGVWAVEPDVGRVAHGVPSRLDQLQCLGNAVVPQVAYWLGKQVVAHSERGNK